jgi:hypothetical protein
MEEYQWPPSATRIRVTRPTINRDVTANETRDGFTEECFQFGDTYVPIPGYVSSLFSLGI